VIVRPSAEHLLLVTQPDHAALAETIMCAWRPGGLDVSRRRESILLAVRAHDDGWIEEDGAPRVDENGRIVDFLRVPDRVRHRIWPLGVARLSASPYAAALVAEHAIQVHAHHRTTPGWGAFFAEMAEHRRTQLAAAAPATSEDLEHDYGFLRVGDLLSLTFCSGWTGLQRDESCEAVLDTSHLLVQPDPFGGRAVPLAVSARRLPNRRYVDRRDAAEAFAAAPLVPITGTASGGAQSGAA
jgi:hypothetical protein